jgi:hypothetical protein
MSSPAEIELGHKVDLYQFYISAYTKGIAFFLAITGALLKFAVDSDDYRQLFSLAGLACNAAVLIPLIFGAFHERRMAAHHRRLAKATGTTFISTAALKMLVWATAVFWAILCLMWVYVLLWLN